MEHAKCVSRPACAIVSLQVMSTSLQHIIIEFGVPDEDSGAADSNRSQKSVAMLLPIDRSLTPDFF